MLSFPLTVVYSDPVLVVLQARPPSADKLTKLNADMIRLLGWIRSRGGASNALPTLLFGPAGNICAPLTPQPYAESGPGPEVVQPVWPESRDGSVQGQIGLHPLRGRGKKKVSVA